MLSRTWGLGGVAPSALGLSLLAAFGAASFALLQGWPLWVVALAVLLPLAPVYMLDVARTARGYGWLALLYVLTVSQVGHFLEHVSQMIEIHMLGLSGPAGSGIFGALEKVTLVVMDCRAASTDLFIDYFAEIDLPAVLSAMGATLTTGETNLLGQLAERHPIR